MKIIAEFNSNEELADFLGAFGANKVLPTIAPEVKTPNATEIKKVIKNEDKATKPMIHDVLKESGTPSTADKEAREDTKEDTKEETKEEDPKITKEMVRSVFTKLIKAGKQKEAKALTEKYGASKLPEVKEEDYVAIYKEAEGLI